MKKLTVTLILFIFITTITGCTCGNTISSTGISTLADIMALLKIWAAIKIDHSIFFYQHYAKFQMAWRI
jgi:hypothetical protein